MKPERPKWTQSAPISLEPNHWVIMLFCVGVLFASLYFYTVTPGRNLLTPRDIGVVAGAILLLLVTQVAEVRFYGVNTPRYVAVLVLAVRMALVELAVQTGRLERLNLAAFLYLIVPMSAYPSLGGKVSWGLVVFYIAVSATKRFLAYPPWSRVADDIASLLYLAMALASWVLMMRAISKERESRTRAERLLQELEASHQQLKAYAAQVAELAAAEERNRLARDIHDGLGHYLTAISIQLEKALAFRERDPQETEQAIRDAKRSARQALQDVRQSVAALHSAQPVFSFTAALSDLAHNMQTGRLAVELQVNGQEVGFSKLALMTLYRAVQEGLTNVQKHSSASQVTIQVDLGEHDVCVTLGDNGCGFDPAILERLGAGRDDHFGLRGMQERLELVGGSIGLESAPGRGTLLVITAPKDPAALQVRGNASEAGKR
jgi:signal transduction histidine kinase